MPSDVLDQGRDRLGAARRQVLTREPVRGVAAAVPSPSSGDAAEGLAKLAGSALDNLAGALGGALLSGGGTERLEQALRDALVATAKKHGKSLLEAAPMGKTLLVAFEVSRAFADGVGFELERVNKKLTDEYDAAIRSVGETIGPDELAALQRLRGWQARDTRELGGIVERGLQAAVSRSLDLILDEAGSALKGVYAQLVDGLAKQFVARDEAFAALNGLITGAADAIPSQRREIERQFFAFAVRLWVKQLADEDLAKSLDSLLRANGRTPDVALLATLIDITARGTFASATGGIFLDGRVLERVREEAEWEAWEAARRLAQRMGIGTRVQVAADGATRIDGATLHVPRAVYARLERGDADHGDALRRFRTATLVLDEFTIALRARLLLVAKAHQRAIDRTRPAQRGDEYERRNALLAREHARADGQARLALTRLRSEFKKLVPPDVLDSAGRLDGGPLIHLPIVTRRRPYGGLSPIPEDDR